VLKVFSLIKRREDLSLDDFRDWVFEKHAPIKAAFASEPGRAAGDDVARHAAGRVRLLTREQRVI